MKTIKEARKEFIEHGGASEGEFASVMQVCLYLAHKEQPDYPLAPISKISEEMVVKQFEKYNEWIDQVKTQIGG